MDKAYNFSLDRAAFALEGEQELEQWLFGRLRGYMVGALPEDLFHPRAGATMDEFARESLRSCLRETAGIEPLLHRVWALFLSQRLRRETALSMVEFGSVVETRLPYLDNDLVNTLMAIPPQWKLSDQIQSHILAKHRPQFLDVINSNTGARLRAGAAEQFFGKARLKVCGKLRMPWYQPYERMGLWLRRELRPFVQNLLLTDRSFDRDLFNPRVVKKLVNDHFNGHRNHTYLVLALMIVELGQRLFIDREPGAVKEDLVLSQGLNARL